MTSLVRSADNFVTRSVAYLMFCGVILLAPQIVRAASETKFSGVTIQSCLQESTRCMSLVTDSMIQAIGRNLYFFRKGTASFLKDKNLESRMSLETGYVDFDLNLMKLSSAEEDIIVDLKTLEIQKFPILGQK